MTQEKLIDAITDLDSDILNRYFDMKADLAAKKKPKKRTWVKWVSVAACFCIMLVSVVFAVQYFDNNQFEIPQTVKFNNTDYVICGSDGEATILEQVNLPTVLTEDLAGKQIAYLEVDNNIFSITETVTDFVLYEYAPYPNSNVYIVLIDGNYYAAIRRDANGYHGIVE